jgi:hypothetical protein
MKSLGEPSQPAPSEDSTGDDGRQEDTGPGPQGAPGPRDTAAYVAELTAELSKLASGAGLDVLAYLLDMARLEATKSVRGLSPDRMTQ